MNFSRVRQGEILLSFAILSWGVFPVFAKAGLSYLSIGWILGLQLAVAAFCNFLYLVVFCSRDSLTPKPFFRDLIGTVAIIGVGYHGLVYYALDYTTAGNVSIVSQTETLFTLMLFSFLGKEKYTRKQLYGALFVIIGATSVLLESATESLGRGELMVLLAAVTAPFGNLFQKRALFKAPALVFLFWRSLLTSACVLLSLRVYYGAFPPFTDIYSCRYSILAGGIIPMFLGKLCTLEAFKRLTIGKSIALFGATPAVTLFAAYFALGEVPSVLQFLGFLFILCGVFLLVELRKGSVRVSEWCVAQRDG